MTTFTNKNFRNIACPICNKRVFSVILEFTPDQFLSKERKEYYNLKILGIDLNTPFFIKKCKGCGFIFVNPRLKKELYFIVYNEAKVGQNKDKDWRRDGSDISYLFETNSKYMAVFPFLSALWYFKDYFKKPKNDGYKQLRLLDYGCGLGNILDLCKAFGIDGVGVEIDSFRLNYCRQKKLNVKLPEELLDSEKFHIIVSTSVIEHVDDLDAYFKYVSDRLFDGGIFSFNGLNPKIIKIEKRRGFYKNVMPLEHINYFTRKTLLVLAKKHNFEEAKGYGVFAIENLFRCAYPFLKRFIFKGFYPNGNFEVVLRKKHKFYD